MSKLATLQKQYKCNNFNLLLNPLAQVVIYRIPTIIAIYRIKLAPRSLINYANLAIACS